MSGGTWYSLRVIRSGLFFVLWLVHLFLADILLSVLLPLSVIHKNFVYEAASLIALSVWKGIQGIFVSINGAHITISGLDCLQQNESAIVIANHVAWTDFYLIQEVACRAKMLSRCRWFAKEQLKWVPFLGWGLWAMGMPLVSRRWTEDEREMQRVFSGVRERRWPIWLISYSEGTRFSPEKRLEAEAWCRQNSKWLGSHLLYPRTKGFVACVQSLRGESDVRAVYDMTIAYAKIPLASADNLKQRPVFQHAPSFAQTIFSSQIHQQWRLHIHVSRHSIENLPTSAGELEKWLEERWLEKGKLLTRLEKQLGC